MSAHHYPPTAPNHARPQSRVSSIPWRRQTSKMFVGVAKKPQHLDAPMAAKIAKLPELLRKDGCAKSCFP
jgi:hypothetical protein